MKPPEAMKPPGAPIGRAQFASVRRWFRGPSRSSARVAVLLIGYSVVLLFAAGFALARATGEGRTGAAVVGVLASLPVALAFAWERLAGLKVGPVEISLTAISEIVLEPDLGEAVIEISRSDAGPAISERVRALIAASSEFLEVNLRTDPYWWPSRLFLLAALLDDYAAVRRLVFVAGDERREYVGMASPHAVRRALAATDLVFEDVYRRAHDEAAKSPAVGMATDPEVLPGQLALKWTNAWYSLTQEAKQGGRVEQPDTPAMVNPDSLRRTLGDQLQRAAIDWDERPADDLMLYRLVETGNEFVALVDGSSRQVKRVVSVRRLTTAIARQTLATRLRR